MLRNESVWGVIRLKPVGPDGGEDFVIKTYAEWGWRFSCPFLRPGKYSVEVEHYRKGGERTVTLPAIEVSGDLEKDLEVPGEDG